MAENGNVYSDKQLALMDDCLREIGEQYLKTYFEKQGLEPPEININHEMNDEMHMDNPYVARAMEQLIGVATQKEICLK